MLCRLLEAWPRDVGYALRGGGWTWKGTEWTMDVYGSGPWVDLVDFELWVDYGQEICASCSAWTTQLPITMSPFIFNTFLPGIYWFRKTNNLPTRVNNPGCSPRSGEGRWPSISSEGCVNVCM